MRTMPRPPDPCRTIHSIQPPILGLFFCDGFSAAKGAGDCSTCPFVVPLHETRGRSRCLLGSRFGDSQSPTAIEYALVVALVVLVCAAAVRSFGSNVITTFTRAGDAVAGYVDAVITSRPADLD
jgi:Flp pilus assembly pilin Flp